MKLMWFLRLSSNTIVNSDDRQVANLRTAFDDYLSIILNCQKLNYIR